MLPFDPLSYVFAWLLDATIGDPPRMAAFHPVVWIGKAISLAERLLYSEKASPGGKFLRGTFLWILVISIVTLSTLAALHLASELGAWPLFALTAFLAWASISAGDLARQAGNVSSLAEAGRLDEARRALSMIVGRDTANLPPREIYRAAFETAAENSSDGVVAPIFYLILGASLGLGPLLGVVYKAVNTLDSMVGYKNARYLHFGRVSARMDDLFNFVPSRLTALIAALLAAFIWGTGWRALKIVLRDARKHSSPNSGYPEAAFAGATGVMIGGSNFYGGVERASLKIGDDALALDAKAVRRALILVWSLSGLTMSAGILFLLII